MGRSDSEQRQHILEAAIEVFAELGLKATTIRLVGRQAKVNSALIYYYYENKEKLFLEAVRFSLGHFLDHLQNRRQPFATARERLGYLVDGLFDYYGRYPQRMKVVATAVHSHPELMASTLNLLLRERVALPFMVLTEGVQLGQLRAENPAFMWWSILGVCLFTFNANRVFAHLDLNGIPLRPPAVTSTRERILDMLLSGLAAAPASEPEVASSSHRP